MLLEMMNEQSHSVDREQRELEEELQFFRNCQMEASGDLSTSEELSSMSSSKEEHEHAAAVVASSSGSRKEDAIAAELARTAELEARRREVEAEEKQRFAQMRKDLEAEWMARLQQQQQDLAARQQSMEEERRKVMEKQLQAVAQERSAEFKSQVEEALKKRLAEPAAVAVSPVVASASSSALVDGIEIELTCPEAADMGSNMTVYWEYKKGRPSLSDWIGYFKKSRGDDSRAYYVYQKTGGSEKGKLEFVVPSKLGICEVRMFQNNDYKMVARSKPIRVGNRCSIDARLGDDALVHVKCNYADKSQASSWDWVGLYPVAEKDNGQHKGAYVYLSKDSVTLPAPKKPGLYVVRYFQSGSGLSALAESAVVEVPDKDALKASVSGDMVEVWWHVESCPNSSRDRVALFREGSVNPLVDSCFFFFFVFFLLMLFCNFLFVW